ncbi:4231_t:CDS:2, partial [Funneliformis caledonium]
MLYERTNGRSRGGQSTSSRGGGLHHSASSMKQYDDDEYENDNYENDDYDQDDTYSSYKTSDRGSPVKICDRDQSIIHDQDPSDVLNAVDNQEQSPSVTTHKESYSINKKSYVDDVDDFVDDHPDTRQNTNNSIKDSNPNIPHPGKPLNNKQIYFTLQTFGTLRQSKITVSSTNEAKSSMF